MANWLFKEEPGHYSYADLEKDGSAVWDGVSNNLALMHLRKVQAGDHVFYYHTGKEKAVVGEMIVLSGPKFDAEKDPKDVSVIVGPVRKLPQPVTLKSIKADKTLKDWDLVRNSRLSIMPVSKAQWKRVMEMSKGL
jgi:predicted RNA-binding protein with PUA-like domain